jgi:NAD(P)-dependent dehydrogenase (short-subunit alcohol dehydrogenase family)
MEKRPVALVTGCSTGIGLETALLLAQKGFRVFAALRNLKKAGPLRQRAEGLSLEILPMDVDQLKSVNRAVASLLQKTGRIDLLVNNAGWGAFGALEEFTDGEILAQYETNVFGLMRVTRAVLPAMRARKSGRIIHIGSLAGKMTFAGIGLYCSSKYAVEALTEGMRTELRPFNIETAVVEPGSIKTPFKVNRRKAAVFLRGKSLYQEVLRNIREYGDSTSRLTPGPRSVARVVLRAAKARRMAVRYSVGLDAVFSPVLRWGLPAFAFDWVMRRAYGKFLKGTHPAAKPFQGTEGGEVALVTGANSGFGLETARLLAKRGLIVYATYRQRSRAGELFSLAKSHTVFPLKMDVRVRSSVERALGLIAKKKGRLDLLINNAGFVVAGFLEDLNDADWKRQFDTNVFGLLRVTRAAAPLLRETGRSVVLNIGSISGRVVFPGIGAYAASKFAVRSLTEGLRMELRPFGIRVGEIAPGTFATKIAASAQYAQGARTGKSPYREFQKGSEKMIKESFEKAAPAEGVARIILQLFRKKNIPPVTMAGADAKVMGLLKKRLPDAWLEWLFRRIFSWSRFPGAGVK